MQVIEQNKALLDEPDAITILMATYNGAEFIDAQLASIAAQSYPNWSLWVSDDGSSDATLAKVRAFAAANPSHAIRIFDGPKAGSAQNFLSLLAHPDLPAGMVAFSDQDDVWMSSKLARAHSQITQIPSARPIGYACMDIATDRHLTPYARQSRKIRSARFSNALVQNVMRGNAIVLNQKAVEVIRKALQSGDGHGVKFHDWWIYLTLSGLEAVILIDQEPGLYYRQHAENEIGANVSGKGFWKRFRLLASRDHQSWIDRNLAAITFTSETFSQQNKRTLDRFRQIRKMAGFAAVNAFIKSDIRWQTRTGTTMMALQAFLGRL